MPATMRGGAGGRYVEQLNAKSVYCQTGYIGGFRVKGDLAGAGCSYVSVVESLVKWNVAPFRQVRYFGQTKPAKRLR